MKQKANQSVGPVMVQQPADQLQSTRLRPSSGSSGAFSKKNGKVSSEQAQNGGSSSFLLPAATTYAAAAAASSAASHGAKTTAQSSGSSSGRHFAHRDATSMVAKSAPQQQRVCHGRVQNLESNVPAQWWMSVFSDSLYLKTDGDVVEDPEITSSEVELLESFPHLLKIFRRGMVSSTEPAPKILDLCCGQGRHAMELAKRYPRLQVSGHDQSEYLIELARERAKQTGVSDRCTFTVGDCRTVPFKDGAFDLVLIMGNSFGYFSSTASDLQVIKECNRVLKRSGDGAYLVLDLTDGNYMKHNFSPRTWEWIDDLTFVCRERQLSKDGKCLVSREVITETERGVVRDQFYMERLYEREEMHMLMEMGGFSVVRDKHQVAPSAQDSKESTSKSGDVVTAARELSKRKEDLGMMEQRMLVTAVKHSTKNKSSSSSSSLAASLLSISSQQAQQKNARSNGDAKLNLKQHLDETRYDASSSGSGNSSSGEHTSSSSETLPPVCDRRSSDSAISTLSGHGSGSVTPSQQHDDAVSAQPPKIGRLVVLMGDPSMSCLGKLHNTWNPEDLATRQKLLDVLQCHWSLSRSDSAVDMVHVNKKHDKRAMNIGEMQVLSTHADLIQMLSHAADHASDTLVFNLCDEGFGNDALQELHVPALLDMLKLPYSGAGPQSFCYDKGLVNRTAAALGVPTPNETYFLGSVTHRNTSPHQLDTADFDKLLSQHDIAYPAFVKPLRGDNSLGITAQSIVHNSHELHSYICQLYDDGIQDVIVQEYLSGPEFSVGVVGNPDTGYHFLPVLQVDYSAIVQQHLEPILGYESKWNPQSPYWSDIKYIRATLPPNVERTLKAWCIVLFERFGCRDYARFDFRADEAIAAATAAATTTAGADTAKDQADPSLALLSALSLSADDGCSLSTDHPSRHVKLLEVNPNPGWCWDGKMAYMAKLDGISYADLVVMILGVAWARVQQGQQEQQQS
ncbi:hypothetical protein RI367_001156 [Sorochytrium milnesiophthora]